MDILIDESLAGQCVRRVLQVELKLSTKMIKSLKYRPLGIAVDGKAVTVRHILSLGECLSLAVEDEESSPALAPVDLPLDILYEETERERKRLFGYGWRRGGFDGRGCARRLRIA